MRYAICLALLISAQPARAIAQQLPPDLVTIQNAKEIDIGSFCVSDISPGSGVIKVGQSHVQADGSLWWEVRINVNASDHSKPDAYFYSKVRKPNTNRGITNCSDTADLAFLKGRLNSATIFAYYRPGTHVPPPGISESARWQIEPGKLDVEFGLATAQLGPLFGANVIAHDAQPGATTLTHRILTVKNPTSEVFFNPSGNEQTGVLQLSTTDVVLSGTQLIVGTKPVTVTLACRYLSGPDKGKVTFTRNVSTDEAGFISGECSKSEVDFPADDWSEANLRATVSSAHVKKISVIGHPDQSELKLAGLVFAASSITYSEGAVKVTPSAPIQADSLGGPIPSSRERLGMQRAAWSGIQTAGAAIQIGSKFHLVGTGDIKFIALSGDMVNGSFDFKPANFPELASVVPITITNISVKFSGQPRAPFVSGSLKASALQLAALGLQKELGPFAFQSDPTVTDALAFGFDLDLSAPAGQFTLGDPDGKNIRVQGQLKKLHMKGELKIDTNSGEPTVSVNPGGLVLDGAVNASVSPLVLGSPVQFVGATVSLASPGGLFFGKSKANGKLDLDAQALIIATPSLAFSNPDQGFIVQAPLRTEGAATIQFDIGSGKAKIRNGRIVADHLEAKGLDTAKSVSISGITLVSPHVTLGNVTVSVTEGSGLIQGSDLHFVTDEMTHDGSPYWKVKLAPQIGLSIPKFDAHLGDTEKDLNIEDVSIQGLNLDGLSAEFRSKDGFQVAGSAFKISADMLTEKLIKNGAVSIAGGNFGLATTADTTKVSAKAAFDNFKLSLDGAKDKLSGAGSIHLHDISINGRFMIPIAKCGAGNGWKLTGAFDIAKVDVGLNLKESTVAGTAVVSEGKAYVVNDGESNCSWNDPYTLVEEQWADVNPCGVVGGSCHIKTIIVPAIKGEINWAADLIKLDASASIQEATISVGGSSSARLCIKQLNLNQPVIIATYNPSIQKGNFVADLMHNLIRIIAATVESPIATSLGSGVSFTTYLSNALGTVCVR